MPPIGGLKKTRITCFSVNTLAILASINRPLFCEESIAMAEPLTKPRFDPQIEVNKPITPDVGQPSPSPTAAPTLDPARELPPSHRIHPVQGRQVREPKSKISEVATNIQQKSETSCWISFTRAFRCSSLSCRKRSPHSSTSCQWR